jgi:hypothetical protein
MPLSGAMDMNSVVSVVFQFSKRMAAIDVAI